MLPNLDEIYQGESVGGCYLIFDVSLGSIPADLFSYFDDTTFVTLGMNRMSFFGYSSNDTTAISFEIPHPASGDPPNLRTVSFRIIQEDPNLIGGWIILEDLFGITCEVSDDKKWKPISVDFYYNTVSAIDRCYKIPENDGLVTWAIGGVKPAVEHYRNLFSLIDISNTPPIWEESTLDPLRYSVIGTLDQVPYLHDFDLSECALSFNRDIALNAINLGNYHWGEAIFIEYPFKWRLAIVNTVPGVSESTSVNKLIFEYLSKKGERVVEEWWDGTKWTIPAGLIDMGKYGVPLQVKSIHASDHFAFCSVVKVLNRIKPQQTDYATAIVLVQEAALRMGLTIPETIQPVLEADRSVIDKNTQLLLGGLNSIAYYSTTLYDWPSMRIDGTYDVIDENTTVINTQDKFPGYDKMISDGFLCNISGDRQVIIQQCNEDRYIEILNLPPGEAHRFDEEGFNVYVQRGNNICFARPLKVGSTLKCVYKTRFPVIDAITGTPVPRFSNDKDLSYIDSELLVIGTVLNYKSYIGDDYRKEAQVFDEYAKYLKSTRAGNKIIKETNQVSISERFPGNRLAY
jgi:hypothetical protein